ncbi:hypothetical protein CTI12_AA092200 [Artemisia annua]|uniref:Uncharacterized protein n=1 Tax=Artemisia annua TaxID=35608 RepID=A0A2U1PZM6_ARTAN|nr:hypothetical protein CTI12_AA092200 [Artemisia annua]
MRSSDSCGCMRSSDSLLQKSNSWLKMLSTDILEGITSLNHHILDLYVFGSWIHLSTLEDVCVLIVKKVQAVYGWSGDIRKESGGGVSTGKLPEYMRRLIQVDSSDKDILPTLTPTIKSDEEVLASGQKIASYQIVFSSEGKIVGFQPTSLLAVNNWASNPLTEELYGRKKLSPGFFEPSLKIKPPT